jgi:hypothetical protein
MLPTSFVRPCAQCGADIIAPEWSEYLSNGWVRNVWTCEACGYGFEDRVYYSAPQGHSSAITQHRDADIECDLLLNVEMRR